jgi:1A family penicillin-binding protein
MQSPKEWRERKFQRGFFIQLKGWARFFLVIGILGIIFAVFSFSLVFAYFSRSLPPPDQLVKRETQESSKIYDRTGKIVLYEIHGDVKRNHIRLSELPKYVSGAAIAIEDKNFYQHKGVNYGSVLKAIFEKVTQGGRLRGASTITQQLVKNAILTSERTFSRKAKEWILSLQIERKYSKDEILELYLNEIPYGSVVYGIETASQTFFGKNAKDLDVAEAATLAALPKAPTYYSPHGAHQDELIARQHIILDLMAEQGYITKDEADLYKQEKVKFRLKRDSILAPHFVKYVQEVLAAEFGEKFLEEGGLSIKTTIDLSKQKIAEEAIQKQAPVNKDQWNAGNAALVAVDPRTGQILAMVGSVDFFDQENDGQVNVTIRDRQPGSSFKPIVYTAAFLKGYTPDTILYDVETNFKDVCIGTPDYAPKNYTGQEYGPVTMRKALAGSLNISAVKTLYLTGVENVVDFATKMGYSTLASQKNRLCLSLVLGGAEVKLLDHVGAFTVLASEGIRHAVTGILSVTDKTGRELFEYEDEKEQIFEKGIARMTTSIMSDNDARSYVFGTNNHLVLSDRPVAAKTGTTNDYKDAWTVGFTPSLVAGVWVGNNDSTEMKKGADGSKIAAPIWREFMEKALLGTPVEQFGDLPENTADKPALRGVTTQEARVKIDRQSGKLATEHTPLRNIIEKVFHPMQSILHTVDKDDPRGPAPDDPTKEQQYEYWEEGIRQWAAKQNITIDYPPYEYDDIHTAENKPELRIVSPRENDTITSRQFFVDIEAEASRGIVEVEYFIDDKFLARENTTPFDLFYTIEDEVSNGFHTLKVYVYDDLNNFDDRNITLNFLLEPLPPEFFWKNIRESVRLRSGSFPYTFAGQIKNVFSVKRIDVYATKQGEGSESIYSEFHPQNSNYSFQWENAPEPGNYELMVVLTDNKDLLYQSETIRAVVIR